MDLKKFLWEAAGRSPKPGLPILSFPAVQKLCVSVPELVRDAGLQARAIELISRETDTLAALGLMDLSVEAEAFGAKVNFLEGEVPAITGRLVSDEEEARALRVPELSAGRAAVYIEGIRRAKERITDKPLLAGMIGPFSLAGRLMDVTEVMYACFDEPEAVRIVLDKAAEYLIKYGLAMKRAGADGILLAEPLAGILSPDMAAAFSVPYVTRIVKELQDGAFGVVYHNCGGSAASMLPAIFSQGAAAYHFGNAVSMRQVLENAPKDVVCMGNIDPAAQFAQGSPESMGAAVRELLAECGGCRNFLPSSGCDIPAQSGWENITAFFEALKG